MRSIVRWVREHPGWYDAALVGMLVLPLIPFALLPGNEDIDAVYQILIFLPLAWRRTAPVASFLGVSALMAGQLLVNDVPLYADVAILLAMYAISAYGPTWARRGALGVGLMAAITSTLDWYDGVLTPSRFVLTSAMMFSVLLAPWALGAYMRTRREYVAGLVDRAHQLERDAAQQATIAAAAERARIAREMHDVVAHSLSVIVVQADGALYASRTRPEVAVETLQTISRTSRSSLAEMRRLLGLLRGDEDAVEAERAPMPTATDVGELVEQVRGSGLDVRAELVGDPGVVDPAAGLTVYRVVQEALTNTLKHAAPGVRARVQVAVGADHVLVRVEDDGGAAPSPVPGNGASAGSATASGGHGILGIRERIALHDGSVEAGPLLGGGFRVEAKIPYEERR